MFWIALIPIAATTDAPVWARSYLYLSTAHLLDLWQTVAAPAAAAAADWMTK